MLLRTYRRSLIAAALATFALGAAACERADTITNSVAPSYDHSSDDSYDYKTSVPVKKLVKYKKTIGDQFASAVISRGGGRLTVGNNTLEIPKRAVDEPTVFTMRVVAGDTVVVQLHATRLVSGRAYGYFDKPVTLYLSYEDADPADVSKLLITYLVDGTTSGEKQGLPSARRFTDKTISAHLFHFSNYALGEN